MTDMILIGDFRIRKSKCIQGPQSGRGLRSLVTWRVSRGGKLIDSFLSLAKARAFVRSQL